MKIVGLGQAQDEATNLETVKMSIDADSVDVLMTNLTSLYSNPVKAVVREYSANALDSHTKAGVTRPIEVTMPTENSPFFVVRDFGVGMSKDEIANVYSRYGLSTKTSNNSEIGGFGLGCKSALAIADRFDIVSVKDGVKTTAYIKKNSRGVGVVHFVSEENTSDANGVTITIPVDERKITSFVENASVFDTWAVGSVLINGEPNKAVQYQENYLEIASAGDVAGWVEIEAKSAFNSRSYFHSGGTWDRIQFSIGGIAYNLEKTWFSSNDPITAEIASGGNTSTRCHDILGTRKAVVNLPIGSVDLTPSREAIMITDKSVRTIVASLNGFLDGVRPAFHNYIQTLPLEQAYDVYANNFSFFADEVDLGKAGWQTDPRTLRPLDYGVKFQGEVMPTYVDVASGEYAELVSVEGQALGEVSYLKRVYSLNACNLISSGYSNSRSANNVLVQVDKVTDEVVNAFRKNLRDYSKSLYSETTIRGLLTSDKNISKWIVAGYGEVVSFDDFLQVAKNFRTAKKSASQTGVKRSAVSYVLLDLAQDNSLSKIDAEVVGDGKGYIYISDVDTLTNFPNSYNIWGSVNEAMRGSTSRVDEDEVKNALAEVFPNGKILFISKNKSVDAFIKRHPNATSYKSAIISEVLKVRKAGELKVLAGVSSITNSTDNAYYEKTSLKDILVALNKKGLLGQIENPFVRDVTYALTNRTAFTRLAELLVAVKPTDASVIAEVSALVSENQIGKNWSILRKMVFGWGGLKLEDNEAQQIVLFLNATTKEKA